jgi:hypothetical protein
VPDDPRAWLIEAGRRAARRPALLALLGRRVFAQDELVSEGWLAMEACKRHGPAMPSSHGKQKQLAKQKKKRQLARQRTQASHVALPAGAAAMVRHAVAYPRGPSFLSAGWRETGEVMPALVTVVVTRVAPGGLLIPAIAMVDRTCLGVKNGYVGRPVSELDLEKHIAKMAEAHGGFEQCDLLLAQSVVYHAVDYARSLGFEPHRDFPEPLFGPRPERLLDTPLAMPSRPVYISGPSDDVSRILAQLRRAVGEGNFHFVGELLGGSGIEQLLGEDYEMEDTMEEDEIDEEERALPEGRASGRE